MRNISDQPIFELKMCVVRKALAELKGIDPTKIHAWDTLKDLGVSPDDFLPLFQKIDMTVFQEKEPIPEVTMEDVEFIFHKMGTVGEIASKLGALVSYKKALKYKDIVTEYQKNKEILENYKKSLG